MFEYLFNHRCFYLLSELKGVLLMNDGLMDLVDNFSGLFVDDRLVDLMDYLLLDDRLDMLVDHILMVLNNHIFVLFSDHILMMLMNYVSVLLFNYWYLNMLHYIIGHSMLFDISSKSLLLEDWLFNMFKNDWSLGNLGSYDFFHI